ncbi:energy-coupling factor ABC transporter substrate-binding protein [Paenibacillus sp. SYP-B3998]|uniref:Cobalt transport protein CbiN n=1 Tax=Paenibacillus sp. SYP-B3998 TaxID=2678564 RepID=A0A6G3ZSR0_9BACL|nr:energy-coupling factor ABC transporter substrate-binding protein [Paenibacillus sp. SYP-B3998]NEW04457.1 energy-coupling factor ABC transporter substrate-binding protein [Paenibacillus sp. SYP-B3998]
MKARTKNIGMLIAVVLLAVLPLVFVKGEFGGADDAAEQLIQSLHPSYEPWFSSLFELPSETESMLFALQAALGAGFIGFAIGLFKGKASKSKDQ